MEEENIRQEFKLKNIDETKNYLTEEINQNKLVNKQDKKICTTLKYIEHFLQFQIFSISACTITGCVSISAFTSLFVIQ